MSKRSARFVLFFMLMAKLHTGYAQQGADSTGAWQLPPLQTVIDSVVQRSALLQAKGLQVDMASQELRIQRKKWADYIYLEGAVNYGLSDQVVIAGLSTQAEAQSGLLTKSEQMRYYAGVAVKLPLSSAISRGNQMELNRLQRQQAQLEQLDARQVLEQMVIDRYYQLQYLHESLLVFSEIYQTLRMSYSKAEHDLQAGRMGLDQFALLASTLGKAKDDLAKARNNYHAAYRKLMAIAGME